MHIYIYITLYYMILYHIVLYYIILYSIEPRGTSKMLRGRTSKYRNRVFGARTSVYTKGGQQIGMLHAKGFIPHPPFPSENPKKSP